MRLHIVVADELVDELDRRVGRGRRSSFIVRALEQALEDERRWEDIESSFGALEDAHDWDEDPAAWVRAQRRADPRRTG